MLVVIEGVSEIVTQIALKRGKSGKYIDILGESGLRPEDSGDPPVKSGRIISLLCCNTWEVHRRFNSVQGAKIP